MQDIDFEAEMYNEVDANSDVASTAHVRGLARCQSSRDYPVLQSLADKGHVQRLSQL